jgi:hypothetical protein
MQATVNPILLTEEEASTLQVDRYIPSQCASRPNQAARGNLSRTIYPEQHRLVRSTIGNVILQEATRKKKSG